MRTDFDEVEKTEVMMEGVSRVEVVTGSVIVTCGTGVMTNAEQSCINNTKNKKHEIKINYMDILNSNYTYDLDDKDKKA